MAKKVLVVDDEKLIVKGIRFSLEQDGMEVDCFAIRWDRRSAEYLWPKANEYFIPDIVLLLIVFWKKFNNFIVDIITLHKGSCSQLRGKPNKRVFTDGWLIKSCLKSVMNVFSRTMELSQYTTQHNCG